MKKSISDLERRILDFIVSESRKKGYKPTYREIAAAVGLKNASGVWHHINNLEKLGYLKRDSNLPRTLTTLGEYSGNRNDVTLIPIVFQTEDSDNEENLKTRGFFPVPKNDIDLSDCYCIVSEDGHLNDINIIEKDYVFFTPKKKPHKGEIGVIKQLSGKLTIEKYLDERRTDYVGTVIGLLRFL